MAINLDSLSPAELQALIKSAEAQMQSAKKSHIQEVRTKIEGLLKSAGLTIDEVYPRRGGQSSKGPKAAVAPKYRNPENPAQTWSGRGKRPLWFSGALKKGVTADSILIGGSATKSAPAKKVAPKATKKAPAKRSAKK
jgi:DNA-binding protein H-NS